MRQMVYLETVWTIPQVNRFSGIIIGYERGIPVYQNNVSPQSQLLIGQLSFSLQYRSKPLNPSSGMAESLVALCLNVSLYALTSLSLFLLLLLAALSRE